jgi:hypothetical protein
MDRQLSGPGVGRGTSMSLTIQLPSVETRNALLESAAFLKPGDPSPSDLANTRLGLPIFTLGLQQIVRGDGLLAAQQTSWRFLARGASGQTVAADVTARPGATPKMASVWRGPQIENTARARVDVERLPDVKARDYELRVLRIPGLRIEAFWLKLPAGDADLVVPFLTLADELRWLQPYPADNFLKIVRAMAEKQLAYEASDPSLD